MPKSKEDWHHITIKVRYKPHGVIDFNRPDLLARKICDDLPKVIWLSDLPGWKGEGDAYLALNIERDIETYKDTPKKLLNTKKHIAKKSMPVRSLSSISMIQKSGSSYSCSIVSSFQSSQTSQMISGEITNASAAY